MTLYKYCAQNEWLYKNLEASELYFNVARQFNDPFDSNPSFVMAYENGHSCELTKWVSCKNPCNNKHIGITSLTREDLNVLMWSYYASSHSGVCMGFDVDKKTVSDFFMRNYSYKISLEKVSYSKSIKRPNIGISDGECISAEKKLAKKDFIKLIKTKNKIWKHEKEWRIIAEHKSEKVFPRPLKYDCNKLKEIIFGANMTLENMVHCLDIIKKRNLSVNKYISVVDHDNYKLKKCKINKTKENNLLSIYSIITSKDCYEKIKRNIADEECDLEQFKNIMGEIRLSDFMNLISGLLEIDGNVDAFIYYNISHLYKYYLENK